MIPGQEKQLIDEKTLRWFGGDELRARVFQEKYALMDMQGDRVESLPSEMWRRVAHEIATAEGSPEKQREWEENFYWLLEDFRFVPGGRILFGAGQQRKTTLLNCYVIPMKKDSIESIFDWCKEAARTYSYGGGVGGDIGILRPKGAPVNNSAIVSTGSVSFMDLMSITTGTIGQSGRRGALMITMPVDHPDIEDFIKVKRNLDKVRYANISVRITDEFMEAVENDRDFELKFINEKVDVRKTVRARDLWTMLVESAHGHAEPGLLFWSQMEKYSTTQYNGMEILSTNPCAEIPLDPYGCCCLGSVNLARFIQHPFSDTSGMDWDRLEKALRFGTRFLDNVLTYNDEKHALEEQKLASRRSRRIGVGFMGLGDMLIQLKMRYDTEEAIAFVDTLFDWMKNIVYDESVNLAIEKGTFTAWDKEKHLAQPFLRERVHPKIVARINEHGLRNAALLTIPPTGSIATLAGTTSGVEPIFALSYTRRSESLSQEFFKVYHTLVKQYMEQEGLEDEEQLPDFFVTSHQINPYLRVKMQATMQKHIDHAISSTINLPEDISMEEVKNIYFQAWKLGCKGMTVYREGSREGILITDKKDKKKITTHEQAIAQNVPLPQSATTPAPFIVEAPDAEKSLSDNGIISPEDSFDRDDHLLLTGKTAKFKMQQGSIYITANHNNRSDKLQEVFVTIGKSGSEEKAYADALGRLISLYLQHGGSTPEVIKTLKGIKGRYNSWYQGRQLHSVPDAVAKALELFNQSSALASVREAANFEVCPQCDAQSMINENGCYHCKSCGYTKCE